LPRVCSSYCAWLECPDQRLRASGRYLYGIAGLSCALGAQSNDSLIALPLSALCVSEGRLTPGPERQLFVDTPKMRAYVNQSAADSAQIHFRYLGPTATQAALGSGASRVQFGLKLHAADPCNLVYAMWRIEPESRLVISVKFNAGLHTSSQCGNRGYQNIKPASSFPLPDLRVGQSHTLSASVNGNTLRALVDDHLVWRGDLPAVAATLRGPAGVRSDNTRLEFELRADNAADAISSQAPACRTGPQESD